MHCLSSGCVPLTLSVWSVCSLMEVARAKCRAPSCCPRHPRWRALCPSPCPTLKPSARPLTVDSAHPHLRVSHPPLPLPSTDPHYCPSLPTVFSQRPVRNQFKGPIGWLALCIVVPSCTTYLSLDHKRCSHYRSSSM